MANYRRLYRDGKVYFFTVVTHDRRHIFDDSEARVELRKAIEVEQMRRPFEILAMVLLPNHLHCLWRLPDDDSDFSVRWACIKKAFTKNWLAHGGSETDVAAYRAKYRERGVWQRRFWEHMVRNEDDFMRHVNYIHYNPVKHGLASCPHAWDYSTFHRWMEHGYYSADWLCSCHGNGMITEELPELAHNAGE